MTTTDSLTKRDTLNLRIQPEARDLIDRAPAPNVRLQKTLQTPAPWDR